MLYFSKLKLFTIYSIIFILTLFSFANFFEFKKDFFFSKNVNLGLDLQGGSYLLLEVDVQPIIKQKLQSKLISLRKVFKDENIKYKNLKISNSKIIFEVTDEKLKNFQDYFFNKENLINTYYPNYKAYELDYSVENNVSAVTYSKFGIIEIKKSALDHSLEIVRRRIDEVGTKDPTIVRRGSEIEF